jgi:hypothetical protein
MRRSRLHNRVGGRRVRCEWRGGGLIVLGLVERSEGLVRYQSEWVGVGIDFVELPGGIGSSPLPMQWRVLL